MVSTQTEAPTCDDTAKVDSGHAAAVAETHASTIFLVGDRAYKLKKPLDLGFLDFRTRESRRQACLQEVALNRRLAPDVYLGVADVTDEAGEVCDHLVVMRRMPARQRLSELVRTDADVTACLRTITRTVAAFHAQAERSAAISAHASAEQIRALWDVGFAQLRPFVGRVLDADLVALVQSLARRYLAGRADLFELRIEERCIVDGHGDLLVDDMYCLDDGPRILDCLEFDAKLRHGDVLSDIAMLAMDLERLGRPDLSQVVLADYREFSGSSLPPTLTHHYIAYRAFVRCKIACLRHAQGGPRAAEEARQLLEIANSHLKRGRVALLLVGGVPGTGKTTLARALGNSMGWVVLHSDDVRHALPGATAQGRADEYEGGNYTPERTDQVYLELLHQAERMLRLGQSVILDATWRDAAKREQACLIANRAGAVLYEVRCEAPARVAAARVVQRTHAGVDSSQASAEIAAKIGDTYDAWPAALAVDTTRRAAEILRDVIDATVGINADYGGAGTNAN
jgi:uncharacterized protein